MICPKCGTAIAEGYMYCPKCGEEVVMVPDFEVELEAGIEETISEVANMMADSVEGETDNNLISTTDDKNHISRKARFLIAVSIVVGLVLIFAISNIVRRVRSYYSYDDQLARLEEEIKEGDHEAAVKTARHVISIKPGDEKARRLLADSYYTLQKYDESIAVLSDLLEDFPLDKEIYEKLIDCFESEGDMDSIIRLSESSGAAAFEDLFLEYVSEVPGFSEEGGNYYGQQAIELLITGNGTIYYTIDGSYPDESSEVYTEPILLDEGETTIRAIHVNDKGIKSEEVSKTYNIIKVTPATPKLLTQSGDYSIPKLIKVEEVQGGTIYYTNDGTDPTVESKEYDPPMPMPLGKSEYRFAIINESGVSSEIVIAEYNLTISGIDKEYAAGLVQLTLLTLGHDVSTHEFKAKYGYSQGSRSYYIIEEYSGKQRQNTVYAVDAQTGEIFTITRNPDAGDYDFGVVR